MNWTTSSMIVSTIRVGARDRMDSGRVVVAGLESMVQLLRFALVLSLAVALFSGSTRAQRAELVRPVARAFVENHGQFDGRALFVARGDSLDCYSIRDGFVTDLRDAPTAAPPSRGERCRRRASVFFTFEGASPRASITGADPLPARFHYFLGSDAARWRTHVPAYRRLRYEGLYQDIDLELEQGDRGELEYDLILGPCADLGQVIVRCDGADCLALDASGALVIETALGQLRQAKPPTFALSTAGDLRPIDCSFRLVDSDRFGFVVPDREIGSVVLIDPGLDYGTYLGGSSDDSAYAVAVDDAGSAYITGITWSADFPVTPGAFDTDFHPYYPSDTNVFVSKLDPSGSTLVYSTYLGGDVYQDWANAIAVDASGSAYVTGIAEGDFPTTPGAYSTRGDNFVTKLDPTGSSLVYSTLIGGTNGWDECFGLAIDQAGAAYATGSSGSTDFPTTPGAFQTAHTYGADAFVTKLNPSGSALVYSTFLGGYDSETDAHAIALDSTGAAYVTGITWADDFPTTPGAFQSASGIADAFVTKLDPSGSALEYSTYLGGASWDEAWGIAVDRSGAAYVAGRTDSGGFPTTPGAFDTVFDSMHTFWSYYNPYDAFVTKLNATGTALVYSTFLGGSEDEYAGTLAIDAAGAVSVVGSTESTDFPVTPGAFATANASTHGYQYDVFVTKLNPRGTALLYSTYVGGSRDDFGTGIALDKAGAAYVVGLTWSADFPTTPLAFDGTLSGQTDGFVAKLELDCPVDARWTNYGSGWPGTHGAPALTATGDPVLCRTIQLELGNSLGAATTGVLFLGFVPGDLPTSFGGHLLLLPIHTVVLRVAASGLVLPVSMPCDGLFCGVSVYLQAVEVDAGASQGVSFTAGLDLILGS